LEIHVATEKIIYFQNGVLLGNRLGYQNDIQFFVLAVRTTILPTQKISGKFPSFASTEEELLMIINKFSVLLYSKVSSVKRQQRDLYNLLGQAFEFK